MNAGFRFLIAFAFGLILFTSAVLFEAKVKNGLEQPVSLYDVAAPY